MSGGQAAVVRATAAVFVDDRRVGSAVLVNERYLVTAAHVLQRQDPATLVKAPVDQVELEFPGLEPGVQADRAIASCLDLGLASVGVDVAVLDLGEDRPVWLPAPVPVWPMARLPDRVQVFGYPLAEGPLAGVWRQFAVAGPAADGAAQLDWTGEAGTFPGHSGGPVIDAAGCTLVGILVEGSERGQFDRFLPVMLIAQVWPQLPRPWLMTGADQGEARSHFARRARGQRSTARGGDLFRGRTFALDRIRGWLTVDEPPGQLLVVTGQPGAGKSSVLARAALSVEAVHGGPGIAFHAQGATVGDFLTALADLTGVDTPTSVDKLVTLLADLTGQTPTRVVVDACDEAASDLDRRQIAEALTELAVLPRLRVAVATRPLAAADPFAPGGLLAVMGVSTSEDSNLIDLDSDAYFDLGGLREFAGALLAQEGMDNPGPPGAAWAQYRCRREVRDRLAAVIAERAERNFLVAAMAAVPLSTARTAIDPAAKGFDPGDIPSGVGEALSKYLDRLPEQRRERDRQLLTALAYARGAGLDDPTWLAFAAALGYSAAVADLESLRRTPAADYLLQTMMTDRSAQPVTRLFHQALTDELLAARHQPSDESKLLEMLLSQAARTGWKDYYLCEHIGEHAAAAGRLDQLLEDPLYLIAVEPARLVPYLDAARSDPARAAATVYRQTAHHLAGIDRLARASELELTAQQVGYRDLANRIAAAAPDRPWQTPWSHSDETAGQQVLTGHVGAVNAVAIGLLPDADATPVIISGGADRTVRVWRLADGTPIGEPLRGHTRPVNAVAIGLLPDADATPVIISGGADRTVRVWRLADGTPIGEPLRGHTGAVTAVATGVLPDGNPAIISSGDDADRTVRVWRLADGAPVGEPLRGHAGPVNAVATGALPDGTPVIVSGAGGGDPTVRVWRLADGTPVGEPLRGHTGAVTAVATGLLPDANATPVIVSSGRGDSTIRMWRLADGTPVGEPLRGHIGPVWAVATGALPDGTPIIVSGGRDRTVRVWQLADGTPAGEPLRGHAGPVSAVATGAGPAIISGGGGRDGTVRVWRLDDGTPAGEPSRGHRGQVNAVAAGTFPDTNATPVIVSGGRDRRVRVWRLADGTPIGEPLRGHAGPVNAVATGALSDGTPVIVSGGRDRTVRVWRLADGAPIGGPLYGHSHPVTSVVTAALLDGTPVIVSGGEDATVRVWRLAGGTPAGKPLRGHTRPVWAVSTGTLPDGSPVIVSGSGDATVRVWRLADGAPIGEPLRGHAAAVTAVVTGALPDGTPVIVSGDRGDTDATVRVWRLDGGTAVGKPLRGHTGPVWAVATGTLPDGSPVIVSGSGDATVRVWRLADGAPLAPSLDLPESVRAVAIHDNIIVTASGANVAVHLPMFLRPMRVFPELST